MAAQHYYIQFGSAFNKDNVQKVVDECIATQLIESKSMSKWIQLISTAVLQVKSIQSNKRSCSVCFVHVMRNVVYGLSVLFLCDMSTSGYFLYPDHTGSLCQREPEKRECKSRTGGQRPTEMAPFLLQVLWRHNDIRSVNTFLLLHAVFENMICQIFLKTARPLSYVFSDELILTLFRMFPNKSTEFHKFTQGDAVFYLVVCHCKW